MIFADPIRLRLTATGVHLAISLVFFALPLFVFARASYPGVFFLGDGGWDGLRIALGVDVVLGPFLTGLIYVKAKRGLRFDLALIACLQVCAFAYGIFTMHSAKPVAIVFGGDFLHSISLPQVSGQDLPKLNSVSDGSAFGIAKPVDPRERMAYAGEALREGRPFHALVKNWRPLSDPDVREQMSMADFRGDLEKLATVEARREAAALLRSPSAANPDAGLFIMQLRYKTAVVLFDQAAGIVLDYRFAPVGDLVSYALTDRLPAAVAGSGSAQGSAP